MPPRNKYPLRVRHAGTDPVHAAKKHGTKGDSTACLLWLDPADPHIWCDDNAEITCTKCIERLGPPPFEYPTPGTVGTLQQRLAEVIDNEVPAGYAELATQRIADTVEKWREEAEDRVRSAVDEALAHLAQDVRSVVSRNLIEKMLRGMDVGGNVASEGMEE